MKTKKKKPVRPDPGPWFATIHPASGGEPAFALIRGIDTICSMRKSGDYTDEQFESNALLLAGAPDLYNACEAALEYVGLRTPGGASDPLYKKLRDAMRKARGETGEVSMSEVRRKGHQRRARTQS